MTQQSKLEKALLASIGTFNERKQLRGMKPAAVVPGAHPEVGDEAEAILDQREAPIEYAGRYYEARCYLLPEDGIVGRCELSVEFQEWELPSDPQSLYNILEALDSNVQLVLHPYENGPLKRLMVAGVKTEMPLGERSADWLDVAFDTLALAAESMKNAADGDVHDRWREVIAMEEEFGGDDDSSAI